MIFIPFKVWTVIKENMLIFCKIYAKQVKTILCVLE